MVASNLTPYALSGETPYWFRFYGTFAAPLFISLAGMMVAFAAQRRGFWHFVRRGILIIAIGAILDTYVWGLVPFLTMDVLYLIGLAMPLTYLFGKVQLAWRIVITLALFAMTPHMQDFTGYRYAPAAFTISSGVQFMEVLREIPLAQSWLVDGWFPVFPWLGVAFAGQLAGTARQRIYSFANKTVFCIGLFFLAVGIYWWQTEPIERFARAGYPDLFYPPTLSFFLVAAGVFMLLFFLVDCTATSRIHLPFRLYGQCSLILYVLHSVVIGYYFIPRRASGSLHSWNEFLLDYLYFMGGLLVVAWCVTLLRGRKAKSYQTP